MFKSVKQLDEAWEETMASYMRGEICYSAFDNERDWVERQREMLSEGGKCE